MPLVIKGDDAITLGIVDWITEHPSTAGKIFGDLVKTQLAIKDVITENQADRFTVDKLFTDQKRLSNPLRFGLYGIGQLNAETAPVT